MLPEQQPLSWLLPDNVEFVVVAQGSGHFLIGHVCSVLFVQRRKREKAQRYNEMNLKKAPAELLK